MGIRTGKREPVTSHTTMAMVFGMVHPQTSTRMVRPQPPTPHTLRRNSGRGATVVSQVFHGNLCTRSFGRISLTQQFSYVVLQLSKNHDRYNLPHLFKFPITCCVVVFISGSLYQKYTVYHQSLYLYLHLICIMPASYQPAWVRG